ncbi:MAG TPA: hypothetical protein VN947_20765 [Polyangia bacterium]|nr:hypothetical protein [Polyangia bacterium]
MLAHIELSEPERRALLTLSTEEREAVIEQLLDRAREELQWQIAVDQAKAR